MEKYKLDDRFWDPDAWNMYPHHRKFFDKLWVADTLGYKCGPCGTPPPDNGLYIVRPCYNLDGMGLGAKITMLSKDQMDKVPPGYFWCELFSGAQHSVNYKWKGWTLTPISSFEGFNHLNELSRFTEWEKSDYLPPAHPLLYQLHDVQDINVEYVDGKIVEIHLRPGQDPNYNHLIPVWSDMNDKVIDEYYTKGFKFIVDYETCYGKLEDSKGNKLARLGFLVK